MATLDKQVLEEGKRKKACVIAASASLWMLASIYLAYFLDQLCQAVVSFQPMTGDWGLRAVLSAY